MCKNQRKVHAVNKGEVLYFNNSLGLSRFFTHEERLRLLRTPLRETQGTPNDERGLVARSSEGERARRQTQKVNHAWARCWHASHVCASMR